MSTLQEMCLCKGEERHGRRCHGGRGLAVSAAADASKAALAVQASLLALGAEEPAVPQLAQYARPLHRGLKPLQEALGVFSFAENYV